MPIRPPNLDDRRYADIVAEARSLIPQYCPEWTNLNDADPGMTLVQLFSWMTEMVVYRLNRVPDKTYIHFLNFIGEERRPAMPAVAPITFTLRGEDPLEIPSFTKCSTRQREDERALTFLTTDRLTVHDASIRRVMAVRGGGSPAVRDVPFRYADGNPSVLQFGAGRGAQIFDLDPIEHGPEAYTPHQYLYIAHDDFRLMDVAVDEGRPLGRLRVRRSSEEGEEGLSVVDFFQWEYPTEEGWMPVQTDEEPEEMLGMVERSIVTSLPGIRPIEGFGVQDDEISLPKPVVDNKWWIRGRLDYEAWLAARMHEDLEVSWSDDRGGEERKLNNWEVRASGRTIELFLQDVPPIRGGWTIRLALVDRSLPAGRRGYLPNYRWYYRRGEAWERIADDHISTQGPLITLTGPLTDMATDGYNIRAERIETVFVRGFCPDLEVEVDWVRPIEIKMYAGDDPRRVEEVLMGEAPWSPFQISATLPPTVGRMWYVGSDLFENRRQAPVLVEMDISFEVNGEIVAEPVDDYMLQLTYRADDNWRVVWSRNKVYTGFTFSKLDKEGAKKKTIRRIRFVLDPAKQLKGLARHTVGERETTWIRFELVKAALSVTDDDKQIHPVVPKIHAVRLGADKTLGDGTYDEPMPAPKSCQLEYRQANRRLTRVVTRARGRLSEDFPFYPFIELDEENQSLYLYFDKPLPKGARHVLQFRCRGEAYLPSGTTVDWEMLEKRGSAKRAAWQRIKVADQGESAEPPYDLTGSGELEFPLPRTPKVGDEGFWLRARFNLPDGMRPEQLPGLPPVTHILLNSVNAVNLTTVRMERFSGYGVPNQVIQLRRRPVFLHASERERPLFPRPETFTDIRVYIEGNEGEKEEWTHVQDLLTADKDDRVFVADPVDGTLTFGNGIRGKMLPVGTNNVVVDCYHVVPGADGNVAAGEVQLSDLGGGVIVTNMLSASGGRNAETIDEIVRRAPSLLTSRDRAVTASDFEVIAKEASGEVARASCSGAMTRAGNVDVTILPRRRQGEVVPDPFLALGLRDHVQGYLKRRCLINVTPVVKLARFLVIDVSLHLRLRPGANIIVAREQAAQWVRRFLDPYQGGLDAEGWPFAGTLYAPDFGRLVSDLPDVRHVSTVELYDLRGDRADRPTPGWEQGQGQEVLHLDEHDLFVVRRVRVTAEDDAR